MSVTERPQPLPGAAAAVGTGRRRLPPGAGSEALWALLTMGLALVAAVVGLRLWDAGLHIPLHGARGDVAVNYVPIKALVDHGWFWTSPDLGAPNGLALYDFTVYFGDLLHFAVLWVLALVSSDPAAVMNVFYVLTFPLAAGTCYAAVRAAGIRPVLACLAGVAFAIIPYHFLRGTSHLFLSAYYAVPIGGYLVLAVLGGRRLFAPRPRRGRLGRVASRRTAWTLLLAVVVATASVYYALFTALLLGLAALALAGAARSWRVALPGVALAGVILATAVAIQAPTLVNQLREGANPVVGQRSPAESEIYGLKLTSLVLPRPAHRAGPLADLERRYGATTPLPSEGSASLGLLATGGLLVGLLLLAAAAVGGGPRTRPWLEARNAAFAAWAAFLVGTVGGGSALVAYLVTPQVRGWNRISIVIAFFALVVTCVALERLLARLRAGTAAAAALAAALGVLAFLDQTSPADVPDHARIAEEWRVDARFAREVEALLEDDATIFQLPYVPFPEHPPVLAMDDYDHLQIYLHTQDLGWSYGQMKGRDADWGDEASLVPLAQLLPKAVAAGFDAVYLDRRGFQDGGAAVERRLRADLGTGAPRIASSDGRLVVWSLEPLKARLLGRPGFSAPEAARSLLDPVSLTVGAGLYDPEPTPDGSFRWAARHAELRLAAEPARDALVRLRLSAPEPAPPGPTVVTVRMPDGGRRVVRPPRGGVTVTLRARATPEGGVISLDTTGPRAISDASDERDLRLRVRVVSVTDTVAADAP